LPASQTSFSFSQTAFTSFSQIAFTSIYIVPTKQCFV
jgi:hypothetical protein